MYGHIDLLCAGIKTMIVHEDFDYDTATNDICLLELQGIGPVTK
jgi:hypothetical protein